MILGVAHNSTPLANPNTSLPMFRIHQFEFTDSIEPIIMTKLNIITLILLPLPTNTPPRIDPIVIPTTEVEDTKVLQSNNLLFLK